MSTIAEMLGKMIDGKGFTPYQMARIRCHSWNPDPEFEDFVVSLNDVVQLFYIKELIRRNTL